MDYKTKQSTQGGASGQNSLNLDWDRPYRVWKVEILSNLNTCLCSIKMYTKKINVCI